MKNRQKGTLVVLVFVGVSMQMYAMEQRRQKFEHTTFEGALRVLPYVEALVHNAESGYPASVGSVLCAHTIASVGSRVVGKGVKFITGTDPLYAFDGYKARLPYVSIIGNFVLKNTIRYALLQRVPFRRICTACGHVVATGSKALFSDKRMFVAGAAFGVTAAGLGYWALGRRVPREIAFVAQTPSYDRALVVRQQDDLPPAYETLIQK